MSDDVSFMINMIALGLVVLMLFAAADKRAELQEQLDRIEQKECVQCPSTPK